MLAFKGVPLSIAPFETLTAPGSVAQNESFRWSAAPTMSGRLWGLDLNQGLPRILTQDGVEAAPGELSRVRSFVAAEFPWFLEEAPGAVPNERMVTAKHEYLRTTCDVIELRHAGQTVGALVGAPEDWSTYYIRVFAFVQPYQRRALIRRFVQDCLFEPLRRHHVERVVADTSPVNVGMACRFSELHFYVTGHQLSDRWGPLVRYTKFLDPACEAAFRRRFAGVAAGGATTARTRKEESP